MGDTPAFHPRIKPKRGKHRTEVTEVTEGDLNWVAKVPWATPRLSVRESGPNEESIARFPFVEFSRTSRRVNARTFGHKTPIPHPNPPPWPL